MYYILIAMLMLEWFLLGQPIVEISSSLLGIAKSFALSDIQGDTSLEGIVALLHIVSSVTLIIALLKKASEKKVYYIPSLVTSLCAMYLYMSVALKLDSLLTDTVLGDLMGMVSVDVKLTGTSAVLLVSAISTCALSIVMILKGGKVKFFENTATEEMVKKPRWDVPMFEKGNLKEAALVLSVLVLAVCVVLVIPTVIQNMFASSLVDEWYEEDARKGDEPIVVFYEDHTCMIQDAGNTVTWETVDGKLKVTDIFGRSEEVSYELKGDKLIIEGVTLVRNPQ